jgi:hypothetical protein
MNSTMPLQHSTNPTTYLYLSHKSTVRALPSTPMSLKWSFSFRFSHQHPVRTSFTCMPFDLPILIFWGYSPNNQLYMIHIPCIIKWIQYSTNKSTTFWCSFITSYLPTCFGCQCGRLHRSNNKNKITLFMLLSSNMEWFWYFCNGNCNFILVLTTLKMATWVADTCQKIFYN